MMGRLLRAARQPLAAWKLLHAVAPTRPIVVIQSDDWGRAGLPSLASLEQLKATGVPIGASPWDFYGLESEDDVIRTRRYAFGVSRQRRKARLRHC